MKKSKKINPSFFFIFLIITVLTFFTRQTALIILFPFFLLRYMAWEEERYRKLAKKIKEDIRTQNNYHYR